MKFTGYLILIAIALPTVVAFWWRGQKLKAPLSYADIILVIGLCTGIGAATWLVCNSALALFKDVTVPKGCDCPPPPFSDNQLSLILFLALASVLAGLTKLFQQWRSIVAPPPS